MYVVYSLIPATSPESRTPSWIPAYMLLIAAAVLVAVSYLPSDAAAPEEGQQERDCAKFMMLLMHAIPVLVALLTFTCLLGQTCSQWKVVLVMIVATWFAALALMLSKMAGRRVRSNVTPLSSPSGPSPQPSGPASAPTEHSPVFVQREYMEADADGAEDVDDADGADDAVALVAQPAPSPVQVQDQDMKPDRLLISPFPVDDFGSASSAFGSGSNDYWGSWISDAGR
jgi:hypothetical protein